jgi:predicted phage baseplate assembly protein
MPIQLPAIDDRRYEQLVQDALARVAIHTPEWTHSGPSDPGVTLVELFAFMAESLLYRANLIPERNRLKFLQLLDIPLRPASPAHGLVQLRNDAGARVNVTRPAGDTYFAGALPFVSDAGLDIPPVEGLAVIKRLLVNTDQTLIDYYRQLYEATGRDFAALSADETTVDGASVEPLLYETVALDDLPAAVDLASEAVDGALWIALLAAPQAGDAERAAVRAELAGRTLSIGLVPAHARRAGGTPDSRQPGDAAALAQRPSAAGAARQDAVRPPGGALAGRFSRTCRRPAGHLAARRSAAHLERRRAARSRRRRPPAAAR